MDSLIYSLNATMPVFIVIVIGWLINRKGFLSKEFISCANKLVFNLCLPLMIFKDLAATDITQVFDMKLVLFSALSTTIAFALIWISAKLFIINKSITGAFVQAAYRSSVAVMGFAFMMNIYGNGGLMPMIIIGCVPLYNIYAVTVLTFEAPDDKISGSFKEKLIKAAAGIIKNPIIIGIIAGCAGSLLNVYDYIPLMLDKTIDSISAIATPLSLILIGASFEGKKAIAAIRPTAVCCVIKLILLPLVFLALAVKAGFRGDALLALAIMLGSPTTPSCYIMAVNMKNDGVLTSSVIAATTLLSSVTLTFWIFILRYLGYII